MNEPLNTSVSLFSNVKEITPTSNAPIRELLYSGKNRELANQIRTSKDPSEIKRLKLFSPCYTPGGIFSSRNREGLTSYSGLMAFDIDAKQNPQITDWNNLKWKLSDSQYVQYVGLSISGNGIFGLVQISNPERYSEHYTALLNHYKKHLGINLDPSCKDITRLRFMSYDINPLSYLPGFTQSFSSIFKEIYPKEIKPLRKPLNGSDLDPVEALIKKIIDSKTNITDEYRYWVAIGGAIFEKYGESGSSVFHELSQFYPGYDFKDCERQFSAIVRNNIRNESNVLFDRAKQYGITLKIQ